MSIENFLLKKNIAKNPAHAKLIMIGVIILCLIFIVIQNWPRSGAPELTLEEIDELQAIDPTFLSDLPEDQVQP